MKILKAKTQAKANAVRLAASMVLEIKRCILKLEIDEHLTWLSQGEYGNCYDDINTPTQNEIMGQARDGTSHVEQFCCQHDARHDKCLNRVI